MTTHTAAAGIGLPTFTLPPLPQDTPAHQLWALYEAVHILAEVATGLSAQPRFAADGTNLYNAAGEVIGELIEQFGRIEGMLVDAARALPAGDGSRNDYRARLLIEDGAACFDGIEIFIPSVLEAAQGKEARA